MNRDKVNSNKKSTPVGHASQLKPGVIQQKTALFAPQVKRPVAPPAYRPQPLPKVLQKKASPIQHSQAGQPSRSPVASPVYRPQPKPAMAQAKIATISQTRTPPTRKDSIVQRYSIQNIPELEGMGKMSDGEKYFIPDKYVGKRIYVAGSADAPRSSDALKARKVYKTETYTRYKSQKFLKDCLHTAEEINADEELKPGGVRSKVLKRRRDPVKPVVPFGKSDDDNIEAAKKYAVGQGASPSVGQAYVIVNKKWPQGVDYPYHAAGVVAEDGKDRVTLEVFASKRDAKARNTEGKYSMYSTGGGGGESFHEHWVKNFFKKRDSATVVIEPKK